jgi:hypothetical protein
MLLIQIISYTLLIIPYAELEVHFLFFSWSSSHLPLNTSKQNTGCITSGCYHNKWSASLCFKWCFLPSGPEQQVSFAQLTGSCPPRTAQFISVFSSVDARSYGTGMLQILQRLLLKLLPTYKCRIPWTLLGCCRKRHKCIVTKTEDRNVCR